MLHSPTSKRSRAGQQISTASFVTKAVGRDPGIRDRSDQVDIQFCPDSYLAL